MDVGGKLLDAEFIEARFRWNFSFCCWRLEYSLFLVVGGGIWYHRKRSLETIRVGVNTTV